MRAEGAPLIEVAQENIDRIAIAGSGGAEVVLRKVQGDWRLPDSGDFPADTGRVERLLQRIGALRPGLPVATTEGARARFKLGQEAFERRITLAQGESPLATFYLGTSPGRGRAHVRVQDRDAIYAVELAAYDLPVEAAQWQDKTVLQLPEADIQAIEVAGLRLHRSETDAAAGETKAGADDSGGEGSAAAWAAAELADGESVKREAVDELAGLLADLRIGEALGTEEKPQYGLGEPVLELTLSRKEGDAVGYRLGRAPGGEAYTLKVSSRPEYFRLPVPMAKALLDAAKRETLVAARETPAQAGEANSGASAQELAAGASPSASAGE